jgi:peptidyl-prolyl cis-trans isomerase D
LTVSREQSQQFPGKLIDAVLRADSAALPVLVGVDLGGQGYAVARVNKVIDFEPANEAARRQNLNQYNQLWTGAESLAYFNELKRRFKAEILAAKPLPGSDSASRSSVQ